ncbi:hypothetical protein DSTSK_08390 [Desulforhabdus sp. TSK]|nr:hypothetical protein DSTSK_08390 [Desulforhabdus sp. TSK]
MDRIILPILGRLQAETLSTQQLNEYIQKRLTEGKKRGTVIREITILKAAFNWAELQDPPLIQRNPLSKYTVPKARDGEIPTRPTEEEVDRILRNAPDHLIRAIGIHWYCGVRPGGEVTRICWADVDFSADELRIVSAQKGGPQTRYIPIHADLRDLLLSWKEMDRKNVGVNKGQ